MNVTNKVQLAGNLGNDPQIKTFESGSKQARFSMATKEVFNTRSGESASNTQWHLVTAWGKVADEVETQFKKGSFVSIEGRLLTRNYTDKTGQKKYVTEVVAYQVCLNT